MWPVLSYGGEVWAMTESWGEMLAIYEGKILRKFFGPFCEKGSGLYVGRSEKLYALLDVWDIVKYI